MIGEKRDHERDDDPMSGLSRRDFVALSLAAWLAAAAGPVWGTELPVIETDVDVRMSRLHNGQMQPWMAVLTSL